MCSWKGIWLYSISHMDKTVKVSQHSLREQGVGSCQSSHEGQALFWHLLKLWTALLMYTSRRYLETCHLNHQYMMWLLPCKVYIHNTRIKYSDKMLLWVLRFSLTTKHWTYSLKSQVHVSLNMDITVLGSYSESSRQPTNWHYCESMYNASKQIV